MNLNRRFTAIGLACGMALTLGLSAQAQTNMKISIAVGQNSHQGVAIDVFAKEVEKRHQLAAIKVQNLLLRRAGLRA
jgi:TRAP-type C4-dicarboxylate transport system substrate-binding protein